MTKQDDIWLTVALCMIVLAGINQRLDINTLEARIEQLEADQ